MCIGPLDWLPPIHFAALLVVVSIITMLVSLLMPSLGRAKEITRKTLCKTNLSALGKGWLLY